MTDHATTMMTFGDVVRVLRHRTGHTAKDTAATIGISAQYLADIEHDRRVPPRATRLLLASTLGCSSDYLDYLAGEVPATIRWSYTGTDEQITEAWAAFRAVLRGEHE